MKRSASQRDLEITDLELDWSSNTSRLALAPATIDACLSHGTQTMDHGSVRSRSRMDSNTTARLNSLQAFFTQMFSVDLFIRMVAVKPQLLLFTARLGGQSGRRQRALKLRSRTKLH